ncbi:hypothetical protein SeMB42_g00636 [Synchytrium endobioticum]|uniref:Uncharacterized protein n=1 Tax=Synchytrium endobioticum TaxID=286115 RepID=A0A507DPX0_9FUNG|nr:hypothetical protein SeLEV6574_g05449 [Synchytrium endobioticum]TPX53643.1 hypothetical protein SeMB42_g00636 [Synchytrium endobioticum]
MFTSTGNIEEKASIYSKSSTSSDGSTGRARDMLKNHTSSSGSPAPDSNRLHQPASHQQTKMNEIYELVVQIRNDLDKFTRDSTGRLTALEEQMLQIDPGALVYKNATSKSNAIRTEGTFTPLADSTAQRKNGQRMDEDEDELGRGLVKRPPKRTRTSMPGSTTTSTAKEEKDGTKSKTVKGRKMGRPRKDRQSAPVVMNNDRSSSSNGVSVVSTSDGKTGSTLTRSRPSDVGVTNGMGAVRDEKKEAEVDKNLSDFCDHLRQYLCETDMYAVTKNLEYELWYGEERFQSIPTRQVSYLIRSFRNAIKSSIYTFIRHILDLETRKSGQEVFTRCKEVLQNEQHLNDGEKKLQSKILARALALCFRGIDSPARRHSWNLYPQPVIAFTMHALTHTLENYGVENSVAENSKKIYEDTMLVLDDFLRTDPEGFEIAMKWLFKAGVDYDESRIWRRLTTGAFITENSTGMNVDAGAESSDTHSNAEAEAAAD